MENTRCFTRDGYMLRLARKEDVNEYYEQGFRSLDPELVRLTGCKSEYTKEEVTSYFFKCLDNEERYDFLFISLEGKIIGESVINEIDDDTNSANFRIGIFRSEFYGKGLGSWVIEKTLEFAFVDIKLHRLSLDVFSYNTRAIRTYEKAGFKHEGVLRDAIKYNDKYADDVLMAILEDEYFALTGNR